jgi:DNA-directed RNA polymerase specialized sigma24 family protein
VSGSDGSANEIIESMESTREISEHDDRRTDLNRLLMRLDSEPANAWEKYRSLRCRLVKFFECNQCPFPEELADEALDRVARKPQEEVIRDVAEFVIGVARNLRLESYKKSQRETHIEDRPGGQESLADPRDHEQEIVAKLDHQSSLTCLRECLGNLKSADRALALDYYSAQEEKQKVHRQKLASAAGITMIALRVRANRLREKLELCVSNCLESRRHMRAGGSLTSTYPSQ